MEPRGLPDALQEGVPVRTLFGELFAPGGSEFVEAAATHTGGFDPLAGDQSLALEPVEHGIERGRLKCDGAAGATLDLAGDFVAVAGAGFDLGQDEQLGAAVLAGPGGRELRG